METNVQKINNRIELQGKLTLMDLRELENRGVDLLPYVSEQKVSESHVSFNKYASIMKYINRT